MARENQGLQIASIILFMTTIILGVTTFIYVSQCKEANVKLDTLTKSEKDMRNEKTESDEKNKELKKLMGFKETDETSEIVQFKDTDMEMYAANKPTGKQFYHQMLEELYNDKNNLYLKIAALTEQMKISDAKFLVREAGSDAQIAQFETASKTAEGVSVTTIAAYDVQQKRITAGNVTIRKQMQQSQTNSNARYAALDVKYRVVRKEVGDLINRAKDESEQRRDIAQKRSFEGADGEIRWVDQRTRTVMINLGRLDLLRTQSTFSVHPPETSNLTTATPKASIEVTRILGDHSAQARIVAHEISDPILAGDKIYTPAWDPGEQTHFALCGLLDIDGDGQSDLRTVMNLIKTNGGVIDCWVDDEGARHDKMSVNTRFLVLGQEADELTSKALRDANGDMLNEAKRLGVKPITLGDLLRRMGWKNRSPVVRYGIGANLDDFQPKPPEGVPRISGGSVSGLFTPRRPPAPKASGGGAY